MKKIKILLCLTLICMLFSSCATGFKLTDERFKLSGKKIAVLAGMNNEPTVAFTVSVAEKLAKKSKFFVIPQRKVKQKYKPYPCKIKGPYKTAYTEIDADYTLSDIKKINSIGKRLRCNYVYVLWAPIAATTTITDGYGRISRYETIHLIGQLFDVSSQKEVGRTKLESCFSTDFQNTIQIGPGKVPKNKTETILMTADYIVEQIIEKTNINNI